MRTSTLFLALLALLTFSPSITAQGIGIGARAGTLGFGAEAAVSLSENLVVRGGLGSFLLEFDGDIDDVGYTISPPSFTGTLGIDIYPAGGSFRLMAGMMFRDGDFKVDSEDISQSGSVEIGDNEYDEAGTLHGVFATKSAAPFVGLGFGHHTQGGFGVFLDLGVAFTGDPDVTLEAKGPVASVPGIQEDLNREVEYLKDEAGSYMEYWPIINLGVKIPIG